MFSIYNKIYNKIKKYETIVIARHIGPDPDSLASQLALRETILSNFPKKKVYAIGSPASKFRYLGRLDKIDNIADLSSALLIVVDTPDLKRIDGANPKDFAYKIKIDHHPSVDKYADIECVDEFASSASQMVATLIQKTRLKLDKEIAKKLYLGIVSDTNRFMFSYTSPETFNIVSWLIKKTNLDITSSYEDLYLRELKNLKFEGYVANNFTLTENGLAYIYVDDETITKYEADAATAGNIVNNFNYIKELLVWVIFSEDKLNDNIRGSIRSRGPVINTVASDYNGGGHIYASGVRLKSKDEIDSLIKELDNTCRNYKKNM